MMFRRLYLAAALLALTQGASAYIDPGTGGMIVGGIGGAVWPIIVAFFAGLAALMVKFFSPIKRGFQLAWQKVRGH
jgi:hypothetical protein